MADNNYSISVVANGLTRTVNYGSTVTVAGSAELHTFSPEYGITSLNIASLEVSSNNAIPTFSIATTASLPLAVTWDGSTTNLENNAIWYTVTIANTAAHADDLATTLRVGVSSYGVSLSSGVTGTMTDATSYSNIYTTTAYATAPSGISGFTLTPGQERIMLRWTNPTNLDLSSIQIERDFDAPPLTHDTGTIVYSGIATEFEHTSLTAGQTAYYSAFSQDNVGNWSTITAAATGTAIPFENNIYGVTGYPYLTNAQIRGRLFDEGII